MYRQARAFKEVLSQQEVTHLIGVSFYRFQNEEPIFYLKIDGTQCTDNSSSPGLACSPMVFFASGKSETKEDGSIHAKRTRAYFSALGPAQFLLGLI